MGVGDRPAGALRPPLAGAAPHGGVGDRPSRGRPLAYKWALETARRGAINGRPLTGGVGDRPSRGRPLAYKWALETAPRRGVGDRPSQGRWRPPLAGAFLGPCAGRPHGGVGDRPCGGVGDRPSQTFVKVGPLGRGGSRCLALQNTAGIPRAEQGDANPSERGQPLRSHPPRRGQNRGIGKAKPPDETETFVKVGPPGRGKQVFGFAKHRSHPPANGYPERSLKEARSASFAFLCQNPR
ncbi:hypothetical protein RRG08_057360 [Elysia crispata]|uniref:Uncharacterized protein n=1 Tax=Elysia crispata TaxID=231223 RepID=A0AAE0YJ50_9GAST|nr:hypothetical protein RRG08_057360 [Elysia crispata]